jgi:hypothetical protein
MALHPSAWRSSGPLVSTKLVGHGPMFPGIRSHSWLAGHAPPAGPRPAWRLPPPLIPLGAFQAASVARSWLMLKFPCSDTLLMVLAIRYRSAVRHTALPHTGSLMPLDEGVRRYVETLHAAGIETYESCEGGDGHCFAEPTVRFYGDRSEGFRALAIAHQHGFPVAAIRRAWPVVDGEPTGPCWEMTFFAKC